MMDDEQTLLAHAYKVTGPDELMEQLKHLHATSLETSVNEFVIFYHLGNQRSYIQVDFSCEPFHFYYKDLLGRPMTKAVENTIAEFLWQHEQKQSRSKDNP